MQKEKALWNIDLKYRFNFYFTVISCNSLNFIYQNYTYTLRSPIYHFIT